MGLLTQDWNSHRTVLQRGYYRKVTLAIAHVEKARPGAIQCAGTPAKASKGRRASPAALSSTQRANRALASLASGILSKFAGIARQTARFVEACTTPYLGNTSARFINHLYVRKRTRHCVGNASALWNLKVIRRRPLLVGKER
jgi:hypothetical protein